MFLLRKYQLLIIKSWPIKIAGTGSDNFSIFLINHCPLPKILPNPISKTSKDFFLFGVTIRTGNHQNRLIIAHIHASPCRMNNLMIMTIRYNTPHILFNFMIGWRLLHTSCLLFIQFGISTC